MGALMGEAPHIDAGFFGFGDVFRQIRQFLPTAFLIGNQLFRPIFLAGDLADDAQSLVHIFIKDNTGTDCDDNDRNTRFRLQLFQTGGVHDIAGNDHIGIRRQQKLRIGIAGVPFPNDGKVGKFRIGHDIGTAAIGLLLPFFNTDEAVPSRPHRCTA